MSKKFTVDPDKQLVIEIAGKDPDRAARRGRRRRGIVAAPSPSELLGRRRGTKITLNFYDLGQRLIGGEWRDVAFLIQPSLQVPTVYGFDPVVADPFTLASYEELNDLLFSVPLSEWRDAYRRLDFESAERYGVDIYLGGNGVFEPAKYYPLARPGSRFHIRDLATTVGSNPAWTPDGLRVEKGSTTFGVASNCAFLKTHTFFGFASTKITATNDYAAPAAGFVFDRDCDIFLVPQPVFEFAFVDPGGGTASRQILNAFYTTLPREFHLELDLPFTAEAVGTGTAFEIPAFMGDEPAPAALNPELLAFLRSRPQTRHFDYFTGGSPAPSSFPIGGAQYFAGHTSFTSIGDYPAAGVPIYEGVLTAVIKKGGSWFYVWNTTASRYNNSAAWSFPAA